MQELVHLLCISWDGVCTFWLSVLDFLGVLVLFFEWLFQVKKFLHSEANLLTQHISHIIKINIITPIHEIIDPIVNLMRFFCIVQTIAYNRSDLLLLHMRQKNLQFL